MACGRRASFRCWRRCCCRPEQKYAYLEADGELRQEFLQDRAVCIVLDVITKMDEVFANLGFGNWMPFRYFDQMTALPG
ncbi:MAG: hypothetical protein HS108_03480 [Planctomycetes bacterium]|nr:hypothetical protein [Planctomycetota bacterium]